MLGLQGWDRSVLRLADRFPCKVEHGTGIVGGFFEEAIALHHNPVIITDTELTPIAGPMMIFAKGQAVLKAIVSELGKGFDVPSIHNILTI
ncbi:hypothetical protein [Leptolyngbya sp. FACHB-16]|uniref:hypothetical protein n=1 Tax=unclassified Leptolyngbya TaxID=2650499 RepID=UPI001F54D456|nr:hypothetical protein [Leptolyngbya sp. FACHB-16]